GLLKMAHPLVVTADSPEAVELARYQLAGYRRHSPPAFTLSVLLPHAERSHWAVFSPDGTRVVTAGGDNTALIWDARTGRPVLPLEHDDLVDSAAFSPDGTLLVTASYDKKARVWNSRTGRLVVQPLVHADWVHSAAFSPDGNRVVTGCKD